MARKRKLDVRFSNHGSIIGCTPITDAGKAWLRENVSAEGWQWMGPMLCIEPRYADPIACGMLADGLEVA